MTQSNDPDPPAADPTYHCSPLMSYVDSYQDEHIGEIEQSGREKARETALDGVPSQMTFSVHVAYSLVNGRILVEEEEEEEEALRLYAARADLMIRCITHSTVHSQQTEGIGVTSGRSAITFVWLAT